MPHQKKSLATGLLVLTIIIVLFLAPGITGVEFQPGTLINGESIKTTRNYPNFPVISGSFWFYLVMFTIWVGLPFTIVCIIKFPEVRKRISQIIFYSGIYGFIFFLLSRKTQETSPEFEEIEKELVDMTIIETQREAAEFFSSVAEVDQTLNIILDISILVIIIVLIWYIYRRFFYQPAQTTDLLKVEVENAISDIESGVNLHNVIVRCYAEMSKILDEQRGIQRPQAMTAREFEHKLQSIGLPYEAIRRLTRLFEEVRYSHKKPSTEAEKEAILCLRAIAEGC